MSLEQLVDAKKTEIALDTQRRKEDENRAEIKRHQKSLASLCRDFSPLLVADPTAILVDIDTDPTNRVPHIRFAYKGIPFYISVSNTDLYVLAIDRGGFGKEIAKLPIGPNAMSELLENLATAKLYRCSKHPECFGLWYNFHCSQCGAEQLGARSVHE